MAQNPNPDVVQRSAWTKIKEAWPMITFAVALSITLAGGYIDLRMNLHDNTTGVASAQAAIKENRANIATRVPSFRYEQDKTNMLTLVADNEETIEELDETLDAFELNNQKIEGKIELEVQKLRSEIKDASREQTIILQDILREIKE